jgi:hypothetical protein
MRKAENNVIPVDSSRFDAIPGMIEDTPFAVTSYFHLRRKSCDLFADDAENPDLGLSCPMPPIPTFICSAQTR